MRCSGCGASGWFKTARLPDGATAVLCDSCWREAGEPVIVPGTAVCTARCDGCGCYGNPGGFTGLAKGGRWGAYSGLCATCLR